MLICPYLCTSEERREDQRDRGQEGQQRRPQGRGGLRRGDHPGLRLDHRRLREARHGPRRGDRGPDRRQGVPLGREGPRQCPHTLGSFASQDFDIRLRSLCGSSAENRGDLRSLPFSLLMNRPPPCSSRTARSTTTPCLALGCDIHTHAHAQDSFVEHICITNSIAGSLKNLFGQGYGCEYHSSGIKFLGLRK